MNKTSDVPVLTFKRRKEMDMDLITLGIAVVLGLIPALIAKNKGKNFFLWWVFGFAFWIVAFPWSLIMKGDPDFIAQKKGLVKCPHCFEWVKEEAIICKHCRRDMRENVVELS